MTEHTAQSHLTVKLSVRDLFGEGGKVAEYLSLCLLPCSEAAHKSLAIEPNLFQGGIEFLTT